MSIPLVDRHYGTVVETDDRRFMLVHKAEPSRGTGLGENDWVGVIISGPRTGFKDTLFLDLPAWHLSEREDPR